MMLLRGGEVSEVAENGLLLAAAEGIEYSGRVLEMAPGDRMVLYTDGIVEARNAAGKMFGDHALMEAVRSTASMAPGQAAMDVIERVKAWAESQEDDLTILMCDYRGASE
jgi:sigma-B regulation protein RsbU (phosphoserine phosphatase)